MDKMKMQTPNKANENFEKLAAMFPNAVTESIDENGEVVRAIDKDILMQEISCKVVEGREERYQFTWPDKKQAILTANAPINKTLRPIKNDETISTGIDSSGNAYCSSGSVDFDNTENLYIEGDNLEVLKLLQETYLGKIKMIYIDPPYNTGKDFIYNDEFVVENSVWNAESGVYNEEGHQIVEKFEKNTINNGRFHTDWLNMIYTRLKLAKDLLANNGVIFISIDDSEQENLRKICDEIFGQSNFIAQFTRKGSGGRQDSKYFAVVHEYIICYAKNSSEYVSGKELKLDESFPFFDEEKGLKYKTQMLRKWGENSRRSDRPNLYYPIQDPDGNEHYPTLTNGEDSCWRWGKDKMFQAIKEGYVEFKKKDGKWNSYEKIYEPTDGSSNTKLFTTIIDDVSNLSGATLLKEIFDGKIFDYPKPVDLIKKIIFYSGIDNKDIILDFFSGSATTAHAVMQLNAEDGGNRKFIMVQLPEETDAKSEAYKAGYKNICEIGKERIRRSGKKILEDLKVRTITKDGTMAMRRTKPENSIYEDESTDIMENPIIVKTTDIWRTPRSDKEYSNLANNLDIGFRVLKCDSSNMKDVYYNPDEYEQNLFDSLSDNIKEDRTPEDLLFQVMLDLGVLLSSKIEETEICGKHVFNVADGFLYACFDADISDDVVKAIAQKQPYYAVFRDSGMASDSVMTNFDQIFAAISPTTVRKVL